VILPQEVGGYLTVAITFAEAREMCMPRKPTTGARAHTRLRLTAGRTPPTIWSCAVPQKRWVTTRTPTSSSCLVWCRW
jgi:hypothetical protein